MASASPSKPHLISKAKLASKDSCAVCLTRYDSTSPGGAVSQGAGLTVRLVCGHTIDLRCIQDWLDAGKNETCPMCSHPIFAKDDLDLPVSSTCGNTSTSSSVAHTDAESNIYGDQINIDRPSPLCQPRPASTNEPVDPPLTPKHEYIPYRTSHHPPAKPGFGGAPTQLPRSEILGSSQVPCQSSDTDIAVGINRHANRSHRTPFIPNEFGLPPPMVRHSRANTPSRINDERNCLPACLTAGHWGNIPTPHHTDPSLAPPRNVQVNLPQSNRRPSTYIPYRPGSYSSGHSSSESRI